MLTDRPQTIGARLAWRIRWIAVRGLAAAVAGVLVLGVGGRLVMLASRLLHPDSVGRFTENGNRIGDFTAEGTFGLIVFGGLLGGLVAGVIWVMVKEWIPARPAAVGLGAVAIGGFNLIESDNPDFEILRGPYVDLILLLGLVFLFGVVLHALDGLFDRRLPAATGPVSVILYSLVAALGLPLMIPAIGILLSEDFWNCLHPPIWIGIFLIVSSLATLIWWALHLRGDAEPSARLRLMGAGSLLLAVAAGAIRLIAEITAIL
jgi:MFS family permease